ALGRNDHQAAALFALGLFSGELIADGERLAARGTLEVDAHRGTPRFVCPAWRVDDTSESLTSRPVPTRPKGGNPPRRRVDLDGHCRCIITESNVQQSTAFSIGISLSRQGERRLGRSTLGLGINRRGVERRKGALDDS